MRTEQGRDDHEGTEPGDEDSDASEASMFDASRRDADGGEDADGGGGAGQKVAVVKRPTGRRGGGRKKGKRRPKNFGCGKDILS